MKETNLIVELIEIQNLVPLSFSLYIKGNRYQLKDIKISEKSTPLTKRALRGGVYISDKFVYQIKALIFDSSLANSLSDFMLGPNFEFKDLKISVDNGVGKWSSVSIIVNLVSSIQKQSKTELTMNIIKMCQE
tara:strand:- start:884 stop:1282 length:399 start_codon:yes stop_codon:yes gene_type:complete